MQSDYVIGARDFSVNFLSGKKLPDQVFLGAGNHFFFFEYACAFSDVAWALFFRLSKIFNDDVVNCKVIEPDACDYYQSNFEREAKFSIAATNDSSAYIELMHEWPKQSIADAMAYRADVFVWAGNSMKWAVWGERNSNICILCIFVDLPALQSVFSEVDNSMPIVTLDEALANFASFELDQNEFNVFSEKMHCTYA